MKYTKHMLMLLLAAAGTAMPLAQAHALWVNIEAAPQVIAPGGTSTLTWRSSGANWCRADGAWSGGRSTSGTFTTGRLWKKSWYKITCFDGTQQQSAWVTVVPRYGSGGLSVELTATPQVIGADQQSKLSWTSQGATWCRSAGGWSGGRAVSGQYWTGTLAKKTWYQITCGDGQNEVSDSVTVVPQTSSADLSVEISATPQVVGSNRSSTLEWSSQGATGCTSAGGWSGGRGLSGSYVTGPLSQKTWYQITCTNGSQTVSDAVTVVVDDAGGGSGGDSGGGTDAPADVSVDLRANPLQVEQNGSSTLSWSSANATWCAASGGWSGGRGLSGSFVTGPLSQDTTFTLSCHNGSNTAVSSVRVTVGASSGSVSLRWQRPTENVDGSNLDDLAGYRVYWGTRSRNYTSSRAVSGQWNTEWSGTLATGTYYFAVTAVDQDGHESAYSNEVQRVVQ